MKQTLSLIGGVVAAALSWSKSHSIAWAVFHFLCGWLYVIFRIVLHFVEGK